MNHGVREQAENLLIREQKIPEDVVDILVEQGADGESVTAIVEDIGDQIRRVKKQRAQKDILYGSSWYVGRIILIGANIGFIFWGAIVFGAIQLFRGFSNS